MKRNNQLDQNRSVKELTESIVKLHNQLQLDVLSMNDDINVLKQGKLYHRPSKRLTNKCSDLQKQIVKLKQDLMNFRILSKKQRLSQKQSYI